MLRPSCRWRPCCPRTDDGHGAARVGTGEPCRASGTDTQKSRGQTGRDGRKRHLQTLQLYGRYQDERLQRTWRRSASGSPPPATGPNLKFTFTVLDTDDVNAHAAPGGYVYVNRGMLAYLTRRMSWPPCWATRSPTSRRKHSSRQAGATAAGVGAVLIGILTGRRDLGNVAGMAGRPAGQRLRPGAGNGGRRTGREIPRPRRLRARTRRWSRADDAEPGDVRRAEAPARKTAAWPAPATRWPRIRTPTSACRKAQAAGEVQNAGGRHRPRPYLCADRWIAFRRRPNEGVVRGSRFYHAGMGMTLAFPSGWSSTTSDEGGRRTPGAEDMLIEGHRPGPIPEHGAERVPRPPAAGPPIDRVQPMKANGLDGHRANMRSIGLPWGNQGPASIAVVYYNSLAYMFLGESRLAAGLPSLEPVFISTSRPSAACAITSSPRPNRTGSGSWTGRAGATIEQIAAGSPHREVRRRGTAAAERAVSQQAAHARAEAQDRGLVRS